MKTMVISSVILIFLSGCQQSDIPLCSSTLLSNEPCRVAAPSAMRQKLEYMAYH